MRRVGLLLAVAFALTAGGAWASDDWDYSASPDNASASTHNRLTHGAWQQHDLADLPGPVGDNDWSIVNPPGRSSYEVVVDGFGGNVPVVSHYAADGTTALPGAVSVDGASYAYTLRWMNTLATTDTNFVLVQAINTGYDTYDRYDIRMFETTIYLARFNNAGTQTTVVICQNPTASAINAREYFWQGNGTLLATNAVTIGAHASSAASAVAGTVGLSGSVTIAHDGAYGSLNCKSVALEPSTGFSFDTPGVYRQK
jgi:hypothetical protein